jgi:hypothetical protein
MIFVRGLPGSGLYATDHQPTSRFAFANSCGTVRYRQTDRFDNTQLGAFSFVINRVSEYGWYNWGTIAVRSAPRLCRNGVYYEAVE